MAKRTSKKKVSAKPPQKTAAEYCVASADTATKVSGEFARTVDQLQEKLRMPVWMLIQDGDHTDRDTVSPVAKKALFDSRNIPALGFERDQKVALLIDSPGGQARSAFEIAALLQKHCGGFSAVIPRRAKSAATLIALGADEIILGEYGELGPLDVQFMDSEREEWISGLDEAQSLERLHAFALTAFDQTMFMLAQRTSQKAGTLIPHVTKLVTQMVQPMFGNIDVVRYTQMSRRLKVGEEYAKRLLMNRFVEFEANGIARKLVELYPDHGFIIDHAEAVRIGLKPKVPDAELLGILNELAILLPNMTAIGRLTEIPK